MVKLPFSEVLKDEVTKKEEIVESFRETEMRVITAGTGVCKLDDGHGGINIYMNERISAVKKNN